jgi:hypothetical protein
VRDVRGGFLSTVGRTDELLLSPERGRDEPPGILGERIELQPEASGKFLGPIIPLEYQHLDQTRIQW